MILMYKIDNEYIKWEISLLNHCQKSFVLFPKFLKIFFNELLINFLVLIYFTRDTQNVL